VDIWANVVSGISTIIASATCSSNGGEENLVDLVWTGRGFQSAYTTGLGTTTWEVIGGWRVLSSVTTAATN